MTKERLSEKAGQLGRLDDDLRNLEASTGIAAIVLDGEQRIGRFTPATRALFDLVPSDVGRRLTDILRKFEDPDLLQDIRRVQATEETREREVVTAEGVWHLRRILPYRTQDGRVAGVVLTFFDITQRHEIERKLRQSEARFRALIENAPDPMILVDAAGGIVLANAQALRFFGYAATELIGVSVETLVPPRLRGIHRANREGYLGHPKVRSMGQKLDLAAVTRDGREVPVEISLSPVAGAEGNLVIAAIRDVGRIRRAVHEAQEAKRVSDAALRAKSRFLATASHDLRQPLHSLSQSTQALMRMVGEPQARRLLEMQRASISSMRSLLNSLLDISKLDSDGVVPRIRPVRLRPIVEGVCDELLAEAGDKGLILRIEGEDLAVRSDDDLLRQLLQNLIVNAVRYTDAGSVTVTIVRQDGRVVIGIADTGRGISAADLPQVFDEFYRIESGRGERGLGLGLAIVRRIAAMLEIGIDVASEPGVGTTFTLSVEASDAAVAPPSATAQAAPLEAAGGTVLLVDDEPSVLESTEALLALEPGLNVVTAASPAQAYLALQRQVPDVLITDMHLGAAETGLDVICEARRRTGTTIPAILVTGDTTGGIEGHGLADLRILTKPTEDGAVIDAVWRFLARGAIAAPPAAAMEPD
ncbi:hybrid sensor histidine kinase/response regulator [Wenxinia saemankumensis]|uniref:histidine kinase n=1 Tax=Wenxinia saemankumensis TaxID=1447782 RepID=A0A1M6HZT6_9RHOB|nr:PAS domain S-box protein [Wenxinia saemankumensis]SHJ27697.1 PAS domain S-box-containing protein [Wenxinia saemankumensis]